MQVLKNLPHRVTEVPNIFIPLTNGERIAVRLFLPDDSDKIPVPAILDFFPYRKSDFSCWRDSANFGYLAGHGFACIKADARGTGDSDGLHLDQFDPQYYSDAAEVIAWIAAQPWCNGKVGMTGVSWPGHATLMTAARRPPALAAIAPINAADDRYLNKYQGGCFLLYGADHSVYMIILDTLPPRPAAVGDAWRERWRERIDRAIQPVENWLAHPWQDEYWSAGTVANDYSAIACPVFAVSGWADTGYAMNVPRLLEGLHTPRKGLIGPWGHRYFSYPGPNIDMLGELKRWFGHWLKAEDNGCMQDPQLIAYMHESSRPDAAATFLPGRWIAERAWPSANISPRKYAINANGIGDVAGREIPVTIKTPLTVGLMAGEWLPWFVAGAAPELGGDQRIDDGQSVCFDSPPLEEDFEILGSPIAILELTTDQPKTQVVVRLCEVFPDGASRRVTYGFVDLAHRDGHAGPVNVEPGRRMTVCLPLYPTAYGFRKGNCLRVGISTSYWPLIWPTAQQPTLSLIAGRSYLEMPERRAAVETKIRDLGEPTAAQGSSMTVIRAPKTRQTLVRDVASEETKLTIDADLGRTRLDDRDIETDTVHQRSFSIRPHDPLSARAEMTWQVRLREGDWQIESRIESVTFATDKTFEVDTKLECSEAGRPFHSRVFRSSIPRG